MLDIFICEDDAVQKKRLNEFVEDYIKGEDQNGLLDMEVKVSTANPIEVIDYIKKYNVTGLYFLDIDLNAKITGIELASEIRKYDKKGDIVFITSHSEMMPLTFEYKVKALDYIVKDQVFDIEKKVIKCIDLANERSLSSQNKPLFYIKSSGKIIREEYENILFFEKVKGTHNILMHTINGIHEFRGTLKEIEKLDSYLCRCNQEIVVNISNIVVFDTKKREIHMVNGSVCYASFRLAKILVREIDRNQERNNAI